MSSRPGTPPPGEEKTIFDVFKGFGQQALELAAGSASSVVAEPAANNIARAVRKSVNDLMVRMGIINKIQELITEEGVDTPLDTYQKWVNFDYESVNLSARQDWDDNIKNRPGLTQMEKVKMFLARWSPRLEFASLIPERQGSLDMQVDMNNKAAQQIQQRRTVRTSRRK